MGTLSPSPGRSKRYQCDLYGSNGHRRAYRTECRQARLLRALLGDEEYRRLLQEIERL